MTISTLAKQLFVAASAQLAALSVGGAFTYPSILLQQLNENDTSIVLDLDTMSWIGSIHGLAGIPSIFMPTIMQWKGRKFAFIIACLVSITGWILATTASSSMAILISECFHGLGNNSIMAVGLLTISEMIAPRFRNVSLVSYFLFQALGMTTCGILGRYLHWKTVSMILCAPISIAMLMAFLWPESPSWLAYKGKFEKCEKAFIWLRGVDEQSKQELQELICAQKENLSIERNKNHGFKLKLRKLFNRDFYVPCFHTFVLLCLTYSSGTTVILIYTVKIIQLATRNKEAAYYGSIFINTIAFIGVTIGALLARLFSNKCILLLSVTGSVTSLLCSSLSVYLQTINILLTDSLIGLYFLVINVLFMSLGIIHLVFTMAAELMPVRHRGPGGALYVIFTCLLHSLALKIALYLFEYIHYSGTLLLYAVNATICGLFIWKFVPETKGRTLQELDDYYTFGNFRITRVSNEVKDHLNPS